MLDDSMAARLSQQYMTRIGGSIGTVVEARFMDNGRLIVILDEFPPYLALYRTDGTRLWQGGQQGDGPAELRYPKTIASRHNEALVLQRGRLSTWHLSSDSLIPSSRPAPKWFFPYGIGVVCDDRLVAYGINGLEANDRPDATRPITVLFNVRLTDGQDAVLEPIWSENRHDDLQIVASHFGTLISGDTSGWVVFHRQNWDIQGPGGRVLEFDCDNTVVRAQREWSLVSGDSVRVKMVGKQVLNTHGVISVPGGFMVAIRKHEGKTRVMRTEIFHFSNGELLNSILLTGYWYLMDYDSHAGALLASILPAPHFIIVPPAHLDVPPSPRRGSHEW